MDSKVKPIAANPKAEILETIKPIIAKPKAESVSGRS